VRLVACPNCHVQYDLANVPPDAAFSCRCGEKIENVERTAVDAPVERCGSCGALAPAESNHCGFCGAEVIRDAERLSALCPECYARNAESARFCAACGVKFAPEPLPTDAPVRSCVDCDRVLAVRRIAGLTVAECGHCHGVWAPEAVFDDLVTRAVTMRKDALSGAVAPATPREERGNPLNVKVRYRKCPDCDRHMLRRNWQKVSGVIVDVCRDHGTWLDADELERIAGFILSGGLSEAERKQAERPNFAVPAESRTGADFTKLMMESNRGRASATVLESFVDFMQKILG